MNSQKADRLISLLKLEPHPEGGYYRETHRSAIGSRTSHSGEENLDEKRAALTHIYFLLKEGQFSKWHQIDGDELWHHYEGDPLELIWFMPGERAYQRQILGIQNEQGKLVQIIPAGAWQAARPLGSYTLAGCTVTPGFDFAQFRLLCELKDEAEALKGRWPELASLL